MSLLKRLWIILLLAVLLVIGMLFAVQNRQMVPLDLLVIQLPEQSLALWLLLAFVMGSLCGIAVSLLAIAAKQRQCMILRKQLKKMQP